MPVNGRAQLLANEDVGQSNASVQPHHLQFSVEPGSKQSQTVEIRNNTEIAQVYRVVYRDFELTQHGESKILEPGSGHQSLSGLVRITPEKIAIGPGETAEVNLTIEVPGGEENNQAAWGVVMIEQADDAIQGSPSQGAMPAGNSISSTLAYSVWVYQNPPEAENRSVDITNFIVGNKEKNKGVYLKVKNKGDGISLCNAYVEITNLATGELILIEGKQYTLLPGARQTLLFDLAEELPKGSYSAVGVLDYDNREEMVATELEFKID